MKRCPTCNRVEVDDTLAFCRTDGVALIDHSGSLAGDTQTAKFGSGPVSSEIETSLLPHTSLLPKSIEAQAQQRPFPRVRFRGQRVIFLSRSDARMLAWVTNFHEFDVTPDGQRFLIGTLIGESKAAPPTVILNWTSELKK